MATNTLRITKAQRLEDIKALLTNTTPTYGTTIDEALEVLNKELEQLAKKNSTPRKKSTNEQDGQFQELIVEFLATLEPSSDGMGCTDISRAIPVLNGQSTSKMSSLLTGLLASGRVKKQKVKGKSLYSLA